MHHSPRPLTTARRSCPRAAASRLRLAAGGCLALLPLLALGEPGHALEPRWELGLGAGAISFPPWPGSSHRNEFLAPAPYVVYRGERFLADRSGLRALLFDSDTVSLRLSLQASPPPDDDEDSARKGMDGLDPVAEFGPELRWRLWQADARDLQLQLRLPLRSAWSVSSNGIDPIGYVSNPALALDLHHNGWKFGLGAGPVFGTADYHDYFYGVAPRDATATRPAWEADTGFGGTQLVSTLTRRKGRLWAGIYLRANWLEGATFDDSPLVRSSTAVSGGVAFAWVFARSKQLVDTRIDD
jgi:outer membrane scaffolding protein for murein synthesis (MipA/OmpV family)